MTVATAGAPPSTEILPDLEQVRAHFDVLNGPGEVREVRILKHVPPSGFGGPSTASGYFDNGEAVARELRGIGSHHAEGVYVTQNAADPELLARASNRIKRKAEQTTADSDVTRRTRLTFDFDPARKAGISSTDSEVDRALARRDAFIHFVTTEQGWSLPLVSMMSGNGAQATWAIDLPADDESTKRVESVLQAADVLFSTTEVAVDTTLSNASRLIKLCGTVAGKGDPLAHRPHRQARGEFHPDAGIVTAAQLRALVALLPEPTSRPQNGRTLYAGGESYDIPALLRTNGIDYTERIRGEMTVYQLDRCLSSDAHNDGAAIVQFPSGAVVYKCHHNTCAGVGWQSIKHRLGIQQSAAGSSTRAGNNGSTPHADAGEHHDARGTRQEASWPAMDDTALYGLAGDIVRAIEPHTEGDPVAILLNTLTMLGSAVGPSPHARVGATRHRANEFVVHVGETSRARKGTAHNEAERILTGADRDWKPRIMGGLSSGEGLIFAVRDPSYKLDKTGNSVLADAGVEDKRLLAVEPEFSSVLRVAGREGNTLSEQLRRAWDGNDLRTLTRNSPLCATAPHISLLGHITRPELLRELSEMYQANGFANRFLFICVRRSKHLPDGGMLPDFALLGLVGKVRRALDAARRRSAVYRDAEANEAWAAVYPALTADRPGIFGAIAARAEAHVLRLSLIYALLDGGEAIRLPHLEAALAVWQYAEDSAKFIFGDATGDPVADQILHALRANGKMTQTQISELFGKNLKASRIQQALAFLLNARLVRTWQGDATTGRVPTYWEATQ